MKLENRLTPLQRLERIAANRKRLQYLKIIDEYKRGLLTDDDLLYRLASVE